MVIAGKIRGNAPQLGRYLFNLGKNKQITILHLDGREDVTPEDFKDFLYSVELNSELTRSNKSAYHAYINPNPEDTTDRIMTKEEWYASVDILTRQLNYEDQRHGVVLHDLGNGRVHAHIVYERYNHERGTMATYEHNYKAHDRARAEMEKALSHKPTPQKNPNRDRHKQTLTEIWKRTKTADEFLREAEANGYKIAKGTDRPFRVIDKDGVSFDLVRKLDGIKTNEVRERFADIELVSDKEAIQEMQSAKKERTQRQDAAPEPQAKEQPSIEEQNEPEQEVIAEEEKARIRKQQIEEIKAEQERNQNRKWLRDMALTALIVIRVAFTWRGTPVKYDAVSDSKPFIDNKAEITKPGKEKIFVNYLDVCNVPNPMNRSIKLNL